MGQSGQKTLPFRKDFSWFFLRQDASETRLKIGVTDLFFEK